MRRFVVVTALLLAVAGTTAAQTVTRVRIGSSVAEGYSEAFFAQEAGLFQNAGLDVDVQAFSVGPVVATAVANGTIDVGAGSTITIAAGLSHGIPFVILAPAVLETPKAPVGRVCVARSSAVRGAKDLEGKTVAVSALRQAGDLAARAWLTAGGADLGKVQIVESSFAAMGAGLERGSFAAAIMSDPTLTLALRTNPIRCIANPYAAIGTTYMEGVWYTTRDFVQKNPELARRVAAAFLATGHWANAHHAETAAIVSRTTKIDIDTIRSENRPIYGETMNPADLQPELDAAYKFGFLARPVSAGELLLK